MSHRPADWNCPKCNLSVFGSKSHCGKCKTQNPAAPPRAAATAPDTRRRDGDWDCPKCTYSVFGSKSHCGKCQMPKPGTGGVVPAAPLARAADWLCPKCSLGDNYKVFGSRSHCGKCGFKNPALN